MLLNSVWLWFSFFSSKVALVNNKSPQHKKLGCEYTYQICFSLTSSLRQNTANKNLDPTVRLQNARSATHSTRYVTVCFSGIKLVITQPSHAVQGFCSQKSLIFAMFFQLSSEIVSHRTLHFCSKAHSQFKTSHILTRFLFGNLIWRRGTICYSHTAQRSTCTPMDIHPTKQKRHLQFIL